MTLTEILKHHEPPAKKNISPQPIQPQLQPQPLATPATIPACLAGCPSRDFWLDAYYPVSSPHCFHCDPPPVLSLTRSLFSIDPRSWPLCEPPDAIRDAIVSLDATGNPGRKGATPTSPSVAQEFAAMWDEYRNSDGSLVTIRRDQAQLGKVGPRKNESWKTWWKKGSGKGCLDFVFQACKNARAKK